jgi:hypothetical protein
MSKTFYIDRLPAYHITEGLWAKLLNHEIDDDDDDRFLELKIVRYNLRVSKSRHVYDFREQKIFDTKCVVIIIFVINK